MSKKKILFVVDLQYDFYDKNGALYVNGGEIVVDNIIKFLKNNNNTIEEVICTADWHEKCDSSFKINGTGKWKTHCVQYTKGAMLNPDFMNYLIDNNIKYSVITKGTMPVHEEYGAFEKIIDKSFNLSTVKYKVLSNFEKTSAVYVEIDYDKYDYYICGIAGDYCVFKTWQNLNAAEINAQPIDDCIAWIGDKFNYTIKK